MEDRNIFQNNINLVIGVNFKFVFIEKGDNSVSETHFIDHSYLQIMHYHYLLFNSIFCNISAISQCAIFN